MSIIESLQACLFQFLLLVSRQEDSTDHDAEESYADIGSRLIEEMEVREEGSGKRALEDDTEDSYAAVQSRLFQDIGIQDPENVISDQ